MLRIKYLTLIVSICLSWMIKAQTQEFDSEHMIDMIPPSPTANGFSRYGQVGVNESMGLIAPQIPLGVYTGGKISLPISMAYSGNGVKVDQAATWTGINWNIMAGGAITRQVRGGDDLVRLGGSRFYSWEELQAMDIFGSTTDYDEIETFVEHPSIDSEVDIFYFNFLGYSGSFYFTETNGVYTAHLENSSAPLKITLLDAEYDENGGLGHFKRTIMIDTPNGMKYFFGGLQASEKSKAANPFYLGGQFVQTGFYLYTIRAVNGDEMYFDYGDFSHYLSTALTESYTRVTTGTNNCSEPGINDSYDMRLLRTYTQGKYLKRIFNNRNSFEVNFSSETASNGLSGHYSHILNGLEIRDSLAVQEKIIDIDFSYFFPKGSNLDNKNEAERFFLKEVRFNGGNEYYSYNMEYKALEQLPDRFSYSQDHLGYYNGKSNTKMLPKTDNYWFLIIGGENFADKSPDFDYASIGVLSKLHYPTKGFTEFEYEAPMGDQGIKQYKTHATLMYYNDYTRTPGNRNPAISILIPPHNGGPNIQCQEEPYVPAQEMAIEIRNVFATKLLLHGTIFRLKIYDQNNIIVPVYEEEFGYNSANEAVQAEDPHYTQTNGIIYRYPDKKFVFLYEEGHEYSISLEVIPHLTDQNAVINASIGRDYYITYPYPCMEDGLGIRVKRTRDVPVVGNETVKRYYYRNGSAIKQPQYLFNSKTRVYCGTSFVFDEFETLTLTSSSLDALYASNRGQQTYGKIIVSLGGDAFENGGIEKEFYVKGNAKPLDYFTHTGIYSLPQVMENKAVGSGTLIKEIFYKRENDHVIPVKEIYRNYTFNKVHSITNNLRQRLYKELSTTITDGDNLYLGLYLTSSYRTDLNSVQTRVFDYNDIVISGEDMDDDGLLSLSELDNMPQILFQQEDFEYNQYVGLPSFKAKKTSDSKIEEEFIYLYPTWESNILTGIAIPTKVELFRNKNGYKESIMTKSNVYTNGLGTYPFNVLSTVLIRKGAISGDLGKTEIQFHEYDSNGNPLEASNGNGGVHTVYIWGYHKEYPIAKIVNSTYQSVADALNISIPELKNYDETNLSSIDSLRDHPMFGNSQITTYRYVPMVGLISRTDPNGYTSFYEYDEFNRLKTVKDQEEKLIEDYRYHFKN